MVVKVLHRRGHARILALKHSLWFAHCTYCKFGPQLRISTPDSKEDIVILFYCDSLKTSNKLNVLFYYSQVAICRSLLRRRDGTSLGLVLVA